MLRLVVAILISIAVPCFAAETVRTPSGMEYTQIREGSGATPGPTDTVIVNYRGTLLNGREFDSSYRSGRAAVFQLDHVIRCWTEGLQLMKVGGKAELSCPSNLGYGAEGIVGSIPPNAPLNFEVELVGIK